MTENSKHDTAGEGLRTSLKEYNWTSDKDYQLALIAFRDLLAPHQQALLERVQKEVIGKDEFEGVPNMVQKLSRNDLRFTQRQALNTITNELKGEK